MGGSTGLLSSPRLQQFPECSRVRFSMGSFDSVFVPQFRAVTDLLSNSWGSRKAGGAFSYLPTQKTFSSGPRESRLCRDLSDSFSSQILAFLLHE